ncbi:MAG: L-aspartate oxidase [Bacteroidetes bacterium]|nr:L-aspartate oxidase [Bacteroidota bacterium]
MIFISDFLVIGSGIAGLSYALKAAKHGTVHVITKKDSAESSTNYAQGGIAAVFSPTDTFDSHIQDTLIAGDGLCDVEAVSQLVKEGPERINELIEIGVKFSVRNGEIELVKEGGHSIHRILHAKDLTGKEIERALLAATNENESIQVFEHRQAIDLITEHHTGGIMKIGHPTCFGAYVLNPETREIDIFLSKITYLCTGGAGQVYLHTTNPGIATGDGIAMAHRAGATVGNLEFMQFHPTSLYSKTKKRFLISEAVRGHGAILRNKAGERFMEKVDPRLELATRDIVARAIDREMKQSGDDYVLLDLSSLPAEEIKDHFPNIFQTCLKEGIDITKEPIPVVPAAHYMCGGVMCDLDGKTAIRNLYVGGETAFTGVHGANRLASNSLLEAVVWAHRSVEDAALVLPELHFETRKIPEWDDKGTTNAEEWILVSHSFNEIKSIMWDYVGIVRSNLRLERARRRIEFIRKEVDEFYRRTRLTPEIVELRNLVLVASLIIECAILRKESRGLHFTTDYPQKTTENNPANTVLL